MNKLKRVLKSLPPLLPIVSSRLYELAAGDLRDRSALVITGESMWSAAGWIGCMGKLQTPSEPLTHPDIPIISLLRHRFFTLPLLVGVWPTVGDFFFSYLRLYYEEDCCCHDEVSANVKPAFLVPTQMDEASRDPSHRQKTEKKDKRNARRHRFCKIYCVSQN